MYGRRAISKSSSIGSSISKSSTNDYCYYGNSSDSIDGCIGSGRNANGRGGISGYSSKSSIYGGSPKSDSYYGGGDGGDCDGGDRSISCSFSSSFSSSPPSNN